MLTFQVGEPFPVPGIDTEGSVFSIEPYTLMLTYWYRHPTEEELSEFRQGAVEIAVTELRDVIFILSRFGRMGMADAAYNPNLTDVKKEIPDIDAGSSRGLSLDCFMVDQATGILMARRLVRLDAVFSKKLKKLVDQSMSRRDSFDREHFVETVEELYRQYSTEDLYRYRLFSMKTKPEDQEG